MNNSPAAHPPKPDDGRQEDEGFTLIEILIAIVLVGILSAVAVVGISSLVSKGSSSACEASMDAAKAASAVYFTSNANAYPATFTAVDDRTASTGGSRSGVNVNTAAARRRHAVADAARHAGVAGTELVPDDDAGSAGSADVRLHLSLTSCPPGDVSASRASSCDPMTSDPDRSDERCATADVGETLIEILFTVVIVGLTFTALFSSLGERRATPATPNATASRPTS